MLACVALAQEDLARLGNESAADLFASADGELVVVCVILRDDVDGSERSWFDFDAEVTSTFASS